MVGPERSDRHGSKAHPYSQRGSGSSHRQRQPIGKDEANELERPSRRLFVRNVQFDTKESEIRKVFEPFGEIKNFCDLIPRRGICFLTFYDLRGAERARTALNGKDLRGRQIQIHFSLPKEDAKQTGPCNREKDQGTLAVTLRNSNQLVDSQALKNHFERFGQVMNVRDTLDPNRKMVEYFDSRDCVAAFDSIIENPVFMGGLLDVEFEWDRFDRLIELNRNAYMAQRSAPAPLSKEGDLNALLQERLKSLKSGSAWNPMIPNATANASWRPAGVNLGPMMPSSGQSSLLSQLGGGSNLLGMLQGSSVSGGIPPNTQMNVASLNLQPSTFSLPGAPTSLPMQIPSSSNLRPTLSNLTPEQSLQLQQLVSMLAPQPQ